jgi:protein gp37
MGENSKIAWTNHTFNPWWGCAKVSDECRHCYAEGVGERFGTKWGPTAIRRMFGDKHWNEPLKWNRSAEVAEVRARVFCASMADVFEDRIDLRDSRSRLWKLIEATPRLDWLLLTKRPQNVCGMLPTEWLDSPRANVWIGTSIGNEKSWRDRALALASVPAVVHFWSCEPLLEPVSILCPRCGGSGNDHRAGDGGGCPGDFPDWVIVGGESGPRARPFHVEWARSIVEQCKDAGVACFVKQLGARTFDRATTGIAGLHPPLELELRDRAGADPAEWPKDLRVRELPATEKAK